MTVVALGSVCGSPGVTRLAIGLAAAWPDGDRARVLVEADPDGGRLGAELGVGVEPGLMELALAARAGGLAGADVLARAAAPVADWFLVPAPPSPEQSASALAHAATTLATTFAADDVATWVIDTGRLSTRSPALPLARAADHTIVVTGGAFSALQLVLHRVEALRRARCRASVVVVEPTSWTATEIADFVGADVAAVLPAVRVRDERMAAMSTTPWRGWWRRVEDLAALLAGDDGDVLERDTAEVVA